jgi:acetylglutamate kinase
VVQITDSRRATLAVQSFGNIEAAVQKPLRQTTKKWVKIHIKDGTILEARQITRKLGKNREKLKK